MNGLFGLNGLGGYIIAVVLLLSVVFGLGYKAVMTQHTQALNPYVIEDINNIKKISTENKKHFQDVKAATKE
ncbi:hypothetical protein B6S12_01335 [Helicobacter valdiviensis]|uniref:DUF4006 domain-containing protein n=1 Tax=Helicobacter valdiviensis TaxID=1458358 RepID=A0A2W6MWR9_9HELI|nr:DUF4006 family protein [Helicobacter valdiviensis]PZT48965.1 hypothetical protein B6S12_01335 [Helicobacter valdiviensis]